jgi:hypothetical protein
MLTRVVASSKNELTRQVHPSWSGLACWLESTAAFEKFPHGCSILLSLKKRRYCILKNILSLKKRFVVFKENKNPLPVEQENTRLFGKGLVGGRFKLTLSKRSLPLTLRFSDRKKWLWVY